MSRGPHEIERNASVSVFLKVLEYYKGIIFLSTNRVVSFNDAFRSRIHIALRFDELDLQTRTKIWQAFIGRLRQSGVWSGELKTYIPPGTGCIVFAFVRSGLCMAVLVDLMRLRPDLILLGYQPESDMRAGCI